MIQRDQQDRLRLLAEVVDGLAFLTPMGETQPPAPDQQEITVELICGGRRQQRLVLALGPGLGRCLAANMGGVMDPAETTPEDALEAALELANVVAGKMAAFATNSEGQAVSLPHVIPATVLDPASSCCLILAEGTVALSWAS
jgi:hypothetical protein